MPEAPFHNRTLVRSVTQKTAKDGQKARKTAKDAKNGE